MVTGSLRTTQVAHHAPQWGSKERRKHPLYSGRQCPSLGSPEGLKGRKYDGKKLP